MKHFLSALLLFWCLQVPAQVSNVSSKVELQVQSITLKDNLRFQYVENGSPSGTPVIFLHGFTDSWKSYDRLLPLLPQNIRAFALTLRGHGDSDKPLNGYSTMDFASDVIAFMDKKKIRQAVIVGHSMGGTITQQLMISYPQRVRGVVLLAAFSAFKNNASVVPFSEEIKQLKDPIDRGYAHGFQAATVAKPLDSLYLQQFVDETMKVPARVWKNVFAGLMETDFKQQLEKSNKPALMIWGALDNFCTKDDHTGLQSALPAAQIVVYEDLGHALHWEDPARIASDVTKFIEKQVGDNKLSGTNK